MTWHEYLVEERADMKRRIYTLSTGVARLHMIHDGVQHDITDETVARLQNNVAEIEQILAEEGVEFDA